ncbi:MAG: hybrid sensor histidine kinase/response regulator [Xenococcaceae cyanobacterium MO_188.B29]|nr:hybrid sensor histidine kinase/response regulator [Xenococcaceae cyanobacterium MO_188.B29]
MAKKTILVISSEKEINQNIHNNIADKNFSFITANSSQSGLTKIRQNTPDLILCQLSTPEIDGYQVLTELRKSSNTFNIPFIFITSAFDAGQWRRAMNLGADDFLLQPFTPPELCEVINTRLAKQEALVTHYKQELDCLRSSILDFLPHEMRTPLTGILASANLLSNQLDELDSTIIRELLGCIDSSSQRLSRLVHNFLLYSELSLISQNPQQKKLIHSQETYLSLEKFAHIVSKFDRSHNQKIDISWRGEEVSLAISLTHLTKLIEELIDNALKFSFVDTSIQVTGYKKGDYFILSVSNYGRGMTAKQIASIGACIQFERPTYEQQGCGLGLAIVKQLVQVYSGKLLINSILNQETRVNVYIPLVKSSLFLRIQPKQNRQNHLITSRIASATSSLSILN